MRCSFESALNSTDTSKGQSAKLEEPKSETDEGITIEVNPVA
jgi:hypothetical protein